MTGTAIVTGASGGIGRGVAERLAKDGFSVVVHYSGNAAKADAVVKAILDRGGKAESVRADISKADEVSQLFEQAKTKFGEIFIVVNCAGIMPLAPIATEHIDAFDKVIATNLRGSYLVMGEAAHHVVEGGRIVLFAHTGTICILILHLMGALDAPELKPVWIGTANCGIARFELRDDGFVRVLAINDTRHLTGIK